jgi:hypothetical protein
MEDFKNDDKSIENGNNKVEGAFVLSLKRNNREIRADRATNISEDTQMEYKREIEDIQVSIKKLNRELENMLDLSPNNTQSLVLASNFDSKSFVKKDIEIGLKIRNLEITLEIAKKRYNYLFGGF